MKALFRPGARHRIALAIQVSLPGLSAWGPAPPAAVGTLPTLTVVGNPLCATEAIAPAAAYSGTGLLLRSKSTLGDTRNGTPGISSTYFGPNARYPIILGLGYRWLSSAIRWLPCIVLAASTFAFAQQHAHTHGLLSLDAAVDARSITLQMEVPLDNFLGFERAPRTEAERRTVADMVARLNAADQLFLPDPAAQCNLSKVDLDSAVLGLGEKAKPAAATSTAAPGKPGKQPEEHADIDVSIVFTCAKAGQARYVDVKLFDAFKGVHTINAQVASGQGQFKRTLTKTSPRLGWGK